MGIVSTSRSLQLLACAALALVFLTPARASAQRPHIDWQRGVLLARAAVPGDLAAPNREMARIKAERRARERCRARLVASIATVPLATGLKAATDRELDWPVAPVELDYGMDGSVVIEMALPLDALRTVFGEADPLVAEDAKGPSALIVDVSKIKLKPALGYALGDGELLYRGPSLFFASDELARKDARVGEHAKQLVARSLKAGTVRLEDKSLTGLVDARPLVVFVLGNDKDDGDKGSKVK